MMRTGTWVGWLCGLVFLLLCMGLVGEISINGSGRKADWGEHATVLPAGVTLLDSSSYVVNDVDLISKVCYGGVKNVNPVKGDRDGIYVDCKLSQKWGVDKPLSPDFSESVKRTIHDPWYQGLVVLTFGLWLLVGLITALVAGCEGIANRRQAKVRAKRQEQERTISRAEQLDALSVAFAKGKITLEEHDKAVEQIVVADDAR